jgi:hypothetical protein
MAVEKSDRRWLIFSDHGNDPSILKAARSHPIQSPEQGGTDAAHDFRQPSGRRPYQV